MAATTATVRFKSPVVTETEEMLWFARSEQRLASMISFKNFGLS